MNLSGTYSAGNTLYTHTVSAWRSNYRFYDDTIFR